MEKIPEAYGSSQSLMAGIFYGLLLYTGIDMFLSEGIFRGLRLLFMDKSLYLDDYERKV